jgi:uncharacterized damage-inducible protein DinB
VTNQHFTPELPPDAVENQCFCFYLGASNQPPRSLVLHNQHVIILETFVVPSRSKIIGLLSLEEIPEMNANPTAIAPDESEFAPYYAKYTSRVKSEDIVATLEAQIEKSTAVLGKITESESAFRYASNKGSIRQMLGHMIDTERIFSYRALRIARGDKTPIEGFEQDDYVSNGPFEHRTMAELLDEFKTVRRASVFLFRGLGREAWTRRGIASNHEVTVRALAYIIVGHEVHHMEVLSQKYLPALKAPR